MSKREIFKRSAAAMGALLFLVTSLSLTILVIWAMHQQSRTNATDSAAQQALDQAQQQCDSQTVSAEKLTPPKPYIPSGKVTELQKTDLVKGTGPAAKSGDCLDVKYYGTLASNGKMFDENYTQPTAFQFQLGLGSVIPGWDEGLVGMQAGGVRRLVIPAKLAYDSSDAIPANSDLVFEVKLTKIEK